MDKTSYFDRAEDDEWARREYTREEHATIEWFMDGCRGDISRPQGSRAGVRDWAVYQEAHVFCLCVFPHFDDKARVMGLFQRILRPGGGLTVAHLEGCRILNKMHSEAGGPVKADRIPPYSEMAGLLGVSGFRVAFFRDEDEGYLLVAKRRGST